MAGQVNKLAKTIKATDRRPAVGVNCSRLWALPGFASIYLSLATCNSISSSGSRTSGSGNFGIESFPLFHRSAINTCRTWRIRYIICIAMRCSANQLVTVSWLKKFYGKIKWKGNFVSQPLGPDPDPGPLNAHHELVPPSKTTLSAQMARPVPCASNKTFGPTLLKIFTHLLG